MDWPPEKREPWFKIGYSEFDLEQNVSKQHRHVLHENGAELNRGNGDKKR